MTWDELQRWVGPWLPVLATVAGWAMAGFADAATGADFESAARRARLGSDPEPQALVIARNMLMMQLEALFSARYHG